MSYLKNDREFRDPTIYHIRDSATFRTDLNKKIINNRIYLEETPDETQHISISGYYEVFDDDAVLTENQFKCDYINRYIVFHPSKEGTTIPSISYHGWGNTLIPAESVYLHSTNPDVVETLQDLADAGKEAIEAVGGIDSAVARANTAEDNLEADITTGNTLHTNLSNKVTEGSTLLTNLTNKDNEGDTLLSNLTGKVTEGGTLLTNLTNKDNEGDSLLTNLTNTVNSANTINGTLTGTITTANTSITELNNTNTQFSVFEPYSTSKTYQPLNKVSYNGSTYVCKTTCTNIVPTNTTYWTLASQKGDAGTNGVNGVWMGVYNASTTYASGSLVSYNGVIYIAKQSSTGNLPTNATYFDVFLSAGTYLEKREYFTATEGQQTFVLTTGSYKPNSNMINVYVWGVKQPKSFYTETSNTRIDTLAGLKSGDKIEISYLQDFPVTPYPSHANEHITSDPIPNATTSVNGLMSSTDKTKLNGIATGATANDTDANLKNRANHTGTQTASTISDFASTVRATVLTGLSTATNAVISATDTILSALGKLQKQITDHFNNTSNPHSVTKAQVGLGNVPNLDTSNPANITQSASYRFVTDTEKATWNGKAETSYVDNKVAELVNSAPETLNTLNELSLALGDDPNFATTISTQLGNKVDKIFGKGLSTNDFDNTYKSKLDGITEDADKVENSTTNGNIKINGIETIVYTHPSSHSPSIITQDSSNRFVTDAQITSWNSKSKVTISTTQPVGMVAGDVWLKKITI